MRAAVVAGLMVLATLAAGRAALVVQRMAGAGSRLTGPRARLRSLLPPPPPWLASRVAETGWDMPVDRAWHAWLGLSIAATATALLLGGPGLAVLAVVVAAGAPAVAWALLRHRGEARFEAALPGAMDEIARGLRSGASLRQAVAEAGRATSGELGQDLRQVARATDHGASLVDSLEEWPRRRHVGGVRLVVAALCLGSEMGGATARAVDGLAATLRQRLTAGAEARALATQARASAAVIAVAPVAFCAVASATDPRTLTFLFRTVPGLAFLAAGLALDVAGALWMARITRVRW